MLPQGAFTYHSLKMQRVRARCWKDVVCCEGGETVEIYRTFSDFYSGRNLYIHPTCGAISAVDSDVEHYQGTDFQRLKDTLRCPQCSGDLKDVLAYPEHFRCPSTGKIERYRYFQQAPPANREEFIVEFWDPLS
jgi:hypothetical protein